MTAVIVIDVEHLVARRGGKVNTEDVIDGSQRRPCEIGTRAEATDVGLPLKGQLFRQGKEGTQADQRIDPPKLSS